MSEPKGVTALEAVAQCLEGLRQLESAPAAAKVRAADRVVAAARWHVKYDTGDSPDELEEALADLDRAGGGP